MKAKNIFIHHDGALGDTLLSLPCISFITDIEDHIHIAGRGDVMQFLKEAGIADEVSSSDSSFYTSLYTESIDEAMKSFLSGFDMSIIFTANIESRIVRNISSVIPGARAILTIPPSGDNEHAAEFRLRQCVYGATAVQGKRTIHIPDNERNEASGLLKERGYVPGSEKLVTIHPGSGGKNKCWPLASYASVIRELMDKPYMFCLLLSGPAEDAETCRMLAQSALGHRKIIHLHEAPLIRVAALLELSDFYLGNDSGISHLAGIMKCSGAVLFGPTDPRLWKPIGGTLKVLHFENLSEATLLRRIAGVSEPAAG